MIIRSVGHADKEVFDTVVTHPVQTWAWGQFRESMGIPIVRIAGYEGKDLTHAMTLTVHKIPGKLPLLNGTTVMYSPRCSMPDALMLEAILKTSRHEQAISVKLEPNVWRKVETEEEFEQLERYKEWFSHERLSVGKPSFAPYSAIIDLARTDEELLAAMKQKTRYNVHLAEKHGVQVGIDNSDEAFEAYLSLTDETTKRQGFYAHTPEYHRKMWDYMHAAGIAQLLVARYEGKIISTWVLFVWKDMLYYPYGASSREHQELMGNYLMMWKAIQFGKQKKLRLFDLWGTLGAEPDPRDAWYGFHRFKMSFGPELIQFLPSRDFVIDPPKYKFFNFLNDKRMQLLKLKAKVAKWTNYPMN